MDSLALIAAAAGLILRWAAARRIEDSSRAAFELRQLQAAWLGAYYGRMYREALDALKPRGHALELPGGDGLTAVYACIKHQGTAGLIKLVHDLKSGQPVRRRRAALVARVATELVNMLNVVGLEATCITSAPPTAEHRRRRGFDPVEDIARAVADGLGLKYRRVLHKDAGALSQRVVKTRAARLGNMAGAVTVRGAVVGERIIVIDDVVTTGATLEACGLALRAAGAVEVWGACVAARV